MASKNGPAEHLCEFCKGLFPADHWRKNPHTGKPNVEGRCKKAISESQTAARKAGRATAEREERKTLVADAAAAAAEIVGKKGGNDLFAPLSGVVSKEERGKDEPTIRRRRIMSAFVQLDRTFDPEELHTLCDLINTFHPKGGGK